MPAPVSSSLSLQTQPHPPLTAATNQPHPPLTAATNQPHPHTSCSTFTPTTSSSQPPAKKDSSLNKKLRN